MCVCVCVCVCVFVGVGVAWKIVANQVQKQKAYQVCQQLNEQ